MLLTLVYLVVMSLLSEIHHYFLPSDILDMQRVKK
ncbi:hypothetical protein CPS_2182 [Colwellia psychrerythraea 34H]|uniref:Uncharacterized protein n=1 Tax=Colwellia psychrerythraea (strain 34H / ATCC BAA-681) TaxID=167879 RepID=Q482W0_COLP3|nr:hypothetical protein CPS_2182 [Colwellia psychrerythraea 34H]